MDHEKEEEILQGSGFKNRDQVAEELAFFRREAIKYRSDEGMPPMEKVLEFRRQFERIKKLADDLGITESEISEGRKRADERVARISQRNRMIERAAQALAHGGYNNLSDTEICVMNWDPEWADAVEARAKEIREGK